MVFKKKNTASRHKQASQGRWGQKLHDFANAKPEKLYKADTQTASRSNDASTRLG
jgi:hypothetical protein